MEPEVLFVDNHLLVCRKPAGVPSVPDESGDESLLDAARAWVEEEFKKPGRAFLGVVHRLDRPVSGVLVFGRTSKGAARLTEAFRARTVEKLYLGVSTKEPRGESPGPSGRLDQWLVKDESKRRVRVVQEGTAGAKRALTRWRVRARKGERFLLELVPETGRPHQLRVAAATLGAPLAGDLKYGAEKPLPDRSVALHAAVLELPHPTLGERMRFEAERPATAVWRGFD